MPNWAQNSVTIAHHDPEKIKVLADAMNADKFLNFVIPVPQDLIDVDFGNADQEAANTEKHGYPNWYQFCTAEWGTKWDVDCSGTVSISESGRIVEASFDSAWSPPFGVYERLLELGYEVVAYYYEPGMGYTGKWDNGMDEYYELNEVSSSTVRDTIGEELDDLFCISENMAEWEAEDEEDLTRWIKNGIESKNERLALT